VRIDPPEGGLREASYAMPEMVRSVSRERLVERWGTLAPTTLSELSRRVQLLLRFT
jgi:mRNA interferase MazF